MIDLASWLLEQIAEEERVAHAVMDGSPYEWSGLTSFIVDGYSDFHLDAGKAHADAWSPARVLAECEAKRRIIEWIIDTGEVVDAKWGDGDAAGDGLRLLALPYTDRPGYLEEWRP